MTPPKADKATMPKEVPVLKADDVIKNGYGTGKKHDLTGWRDEVFLGSGKHMSDPSDKLLMKVTVALRKAIKAADPSFGDNSYMSEWSDSHTGGEVAAVWNTAMQAMGFDKDGHRAVKSKKAAKPAKKAKKK